MSELLAAGSLDRLTPPDRARAQRLATGVLRNLSRVDHLIARHVAHMPPLPILNILRLGTLELAESGQAHGVVNDLVNIASRVKHHGRLKGLVNAVLRKISKDASDLWHGLDVPKTPDWLRDPLCAAWGPDAVAGMEHAHAAGAPLDISPKAPGADVAGQTGGLLLPTGSVRVATPGQVSAMPGFAQGDWWVQDAAAALPAKFATGTDVLDLCAAPGGKTLQLAAAGR
ncbi:MAG: transcription antitermination factor NusB, partial [Mangrovicoccus sp.]